MKPYQGQELVGEPFCGVIVNAAGATCGAPAAGHFMWDESGDNGCACLDHLALAQSYSPFDQHPFGPDCTMPGSDWILSDEDGPGTCRFASDTEPSLAVGRTLELATWGSV